MILFYRTISILMEIPNGTFSEYQIPLLDKKSGSICSILLNLIHFTTMVWRSCASPISSKAMRASVGTESERILIITKTYTGARTTDATNDYITHSHFQERFRTAMTNSFLRTASLTPIRICKRIWVGSREMHMHPISTFVVHWLERWLETNVNSFH